MRLSRNFTLNEFLKTSSKLPNDPTQSEIANIADLATSIMQPIRDMFGEQIITSGFRSELVNKDKGGEPTSQHRYGEACDFIPKEYSIDKVYHWIVRESSLLYGQCILENKNGKRWIHISLPTSRHKQEALVYDGHKYSKYC